MGAGSATWTRVIASGKDALRRVGTGQRIAHKPQVTAPPDASGLRYVPTDLAIEKMHTVGGIALVTYPERFRSWDAAFDGVEVLSLHTAAKSANKLLAAGDLLWSFPSYPELTLLSHISRPDANLAKYDEVTAARPAAAADAAVNLHLPSLISRPCGTHRPECRSLWASSASMSAAWTCTSVSAACFARSSHTPAVRAAGGGAVGRGRPWAPWRS